MKKRRLKGVKLIIYDFDGVFTDNKVIVNEDGVESVIVNRADGLAVSIIKKMKIPQLIITTETNKVVQMRAKKLDIPLISEVDDKKSAVMQYCKKNGISPRDVAYVGNDLNDLEAMDIIGYPICPSDACEEIKKISVFILDTPGGQGVAREMLNYLVA